MKQEIPREEVLGSGPKNQARGPDILGKGLILINPDIRLYIIALITICRKGSYEIFLRHYVIGLVGLAVGFLAFWPGLTTQGQGAASPQGKPALYEFGSPVRR